MPCAIIYHGNETIRIPQGSNNPMVIEMDGPVDMAEICVSLWNDRKNLKENPIKKWTTDEVTVESNRIICPLTEDETTGFPESGMILEVKGLDKDGYTVFWEQCRVHVQARHDKIIRMLGDEST